MNGNILKRHLFASTVIAGALSGALMTPAFAQDDATEDTARQDTVVVTGSRIEKQDFVSSSPVATVDSSQFALTGTVNTEGLLNTLPQTVPGLDRTSNNPGNGTATVDLRGLGSNRTLVLIDGKRMVPTSGGGVVDINSIPSALVERVEVVTGGASAVYGSDAISGVVNFIMKDDFEGVEFSTSAEMTEDNDAQLYSTALTVGGNFDEGRGNAVLSLSYNKREALFQGDRDFAYFAQFDDYAGGLYNGGSSGIPGTSVFAVGVGTGSAANCDSFGVTFTTGGDVRCFIDTGDNNDFYNYAPVNYIQLPQERFQGTAMASYEINPSAEVYTKMVFALNDVPQQLAATPIFQSGTQFSLDNSPFLTPAAQQILSDAFGDGVDTDGDGIDDTATMYVRRRLLEVGPRISDDQFYAFQFTGGVRGEITENIDYDLSYQEGRVLNSTAQRGNVSRTRFLQALLLADADGDGNVDLDASGNASCADGSANGSTVGCAPINIFGEGNISSAGAAFLNTAVNADARYNQRIFSGTVTGNTEGTFSLPGGPVGFAAGVEYREEEFDFDPSQDLASGNIAGFNGSPAIPNSSFDTYDVFGELYLPFLIDHQYADTLAMELAYRYSNYSTVGGVQAYKISGEYAPVEDFRFRASYNTAVRAPNIVELYSPQGEGFPPAQDPCSAAGSPSAAVAAICQATGVPANVVGSPAINLPAGQVRAVSGGNPDLMEETAETITLGVVFQPSALPGFSASVDYFDITLEDAIFGFGGGAANILDTCYNDTDLGGAGSPFCNVITRRADGTIDNVQVLSQNVGSVELAGVDVQVDYTFEPMDGKYGLFNLGFLGTYTDKYDIESFPGADVDSCAGRFGALVCGEPIPSYKHRASLRWANGPYTAQLLWRYVGEVEDDDDGTDYAVESIDGTSYFDLSGSWEATDFLTFTAGIDNLLAEDPPILGDNQEQANTYPATYDVFGRTFFASAKFRF